MKRTLFIPLCLSAAFLLAQFIPLEGASAANAPAKTGEIPIEETLEIPTEVAGIFRRSCFDCHSNETSWPWYSRIAPTSWIVAADVRNARKTMNFSAWPSSQMYSVGILPSICQAAKEQRMPPWQYELAHPSKGLNQSEVQALCQWAETETKEILRQIRADRKSKTERRKK
jgi:hypothetical protein